jgi:hypothetical protein
MGLAEMLFGPDGVGGQPGLVGKAGNAVWNGTGELGPDAGFLETLGKSLGNIPHMLTDIAVKNPLEILKNPASALNDRGEVSLTRLLFPDFRRETVKQQQQAAKVNEAVDQAKVVNAYSDLAQIVFGQPGVQTAEAGMAAGLPPAEAEAAAARDAESEARLQQGQQVLGGFLPPEVAGFVRDPEKVPGLYLQNEENKAQATQQSGANRRAEMTETEKKVGALQRARASGDPTAIAAAEADLLKIEGSNGTMVAFNPDGTPLAVGPADVVSAFGGQAAQDRAKDQADAARRAKATIGDILKIAETNEAAFGLAGGVKGTVQNLAMQGKAFTSLREQAQADAEAGRIDDEVQAVLFDPNVDELSSFENTLAYAVARSQSNDGRVSDADYKAAIDNIRGGGVMGSWLSNAESTKAKMGAITKDLDRVIATSEARAGSGKKPITKLRAAVEGKPVEEPAPKKKGKKGLGKKKGPGTTRGGEIPDAELKLLEDSTTLEGLSDSDYARWRKLKGLSVE